MLLVFLEDEDRRMDVCCRRAFCIRRAFFSLAFCSCITEYCELHNRDIATHRDDDKNNDFRMETAVYMHRCGFLKPKSLSK